MNKQELHHELKRLRADLQQLETPDNADRELLSRLEEDIRRILERTDTDSEHYQYLTERLRDAITRLEAAHPRTTMLMRQVLDQMSYLGI
jgi:chromosome segregation ATPase